VLVVHVLILFGLVVLALTIAFLSQRRKKKDAEKPEYTVALGFVASSYGLLLGLLVSFGVSHYTDVRHEAQEEANQLLALWDNVAIYPPQIRDPARRDLLCYMRAIRDNDWPSMERGSHLQTHHAQAFGDRLRTTILHLPQKRPGEASAYGRAQTTVIEADKARQELLFFTESNVPTVIWVVIYVGAFLLFLLIAMHYAGRPAGRAVSLGSVVALLTVVVGVLSVVDQPYGPVARVSPSSLRHAIDLVNPHRERTGLYAPCIKPRPA
jgi:hypothetical protein